MNEQKILIISTVILGGLVLTIIVYLIYEHIKEVRSFSSLSRTNVGLTNVDNTSDVSKPVSMAQQLALDKKVDKTTNVNGYALSSNVQLAKNDIGLDQVDNTADINKSISQQQQLVNLTKADKLTMICSMNNYLSKDMSDTHGFNIQDFPSSQLGDENTGADYSFVDTVKRPRLVSTVDGSWLPMLYLPNVSDYPKYSHFYFRCLSSLGTNINTARSDQTDYSYIPLSPRQLAVFVSTGSTWNYLGHLEV